MGNFISKLKSETHKIDLINSSNLKNLSLLQIREYLANFKMICETFSINFTEFEQIFSNINFGKEFFIWDTDNNGLIDSLELFNGLILFSDASTEEKIKFLFDLFDFNEISSIGYYDLCFLLETAVSASLKIHKLAMTLPSDEIEEMIGKFLIPTRRIKLSEMKRFLSELSEVNSFLQLFKLNPLHVSNLKIKCEEGFKLNADVKIYL
jgi:Ca2+-binding EF-hand superfamily protein